jgi:TolB-like protein
MFKKSILVSLIFLLAGNLYAEKIRIAIIDFKPDGVSQTFSRRVSELIRNEMINTGSYTIIERTSMDSILKEQAFQQAGCTDDSCAVTIGRLLSAKKMLIGTILKLGNKTVITGRIVDVERGTADFSHSQVVRSESRLFHAISLFAKNLTLRMQGKKPIDQSVFTEGNKIPERKDPKLPVYEETLDPDEARKKASVKGKYFNLIQVLNCPKDRRSYGTFREWGYWSGNKWCGKSVKKGYWVWVAPNWYIWRGRK